jgi:splicing factor 3A subunit 3
MDSLLEIQRQTHEEIERFDRALYAVLSRPSLDQETNLQNEHKAFQILSRITARATALNTLYEDEAARNAESEALSAQGKANDLSEFYSRLVKIQEHYSKYPDSTPGGGFELELASFLGELGLEDEDYDEEDRAYSYISTMSVF